MTPSRKLRVGLLGALALALLCRAPAIGNEPTDFQATRQLRGAIVARGFEARLHPPADERSAETARATANDEGLLEPPLLDAVTGTLWAAAGERLWVPRLLAAIGFLSGAVALWLVGDRLLGRTCAWSALAYYAFAQYGLVASTAIQPDPWLVAGLCYVVLASVRWMEQPDARRRRVLMATTAFTVFVKPIIAPIVIGVVVAARLADPAARRALAGGRTPRILLASVLPGALFLGVGTATGAITTTQASTSFIPSLLWTGSFWRGWLVQIGVVVTLPIFIVAVLGLVVLAPPRLRAIGIGALSGYVAFGLTVDYRISTHDYYSMPLLPIVALGIGVGVSWLLTTLPQYRAVVTASLVALLAIGLVVVWRDETDVHRRWSSIVTEYRTTGASVRGRTAVVLAEDSGGSYGFYARVRFVAWPTRADLNLDQLSGNSIPPARDRLRDIRAHSDADVFVVTELAEIHAQPDLQAVLDDFTVLYRSSDLAIYQLPPSP